MVGNMLSVIRTPEGRRMQPNTVTLKGKSLQSSCKSKSRAEYSFQTYLDIGRLGVGNVAATSIIDKSAQA